MEQSAGNRAFHQPAQLLQESPALAKNSAGHNEFRQLLADNYDTWSRMDVDATRRFYATDVVNYETMPPIEGFNGWSDWTATLRKAIFGVATSVQLRANDDLRVWRRGNTAWTAFTFRMLIAFEDGRKTQIDGRQTNVWERRDGDWLIVHEHASVPVPPGASTNPAQPEARKTATGDPEFEGLVRDWFATWSTLNADAAAEFYAADEDLVFYNLFPPIAGAVGWEALRREQLDRFARIESAQFTPNSDLRVWRRGNVAWTVNTFHVSAKARGGPASEVDARVTLVWERRNGTWLIMHEHLSASLAE